MIGQTKDVGFEIGVSKTLPVPVDEVWALLTSPEGVALWLGRGAELGRTKGDRYTTADGTTGEIRSFHEHSRLRLTWRPAGWDHDTTVQVTVQAQNDRTVLRFHQEWLAVPEERARQRDHWRAVMATMVDALS